MVGPKFIGLCGPKYGGKDSVAGFIMTMDNRFRRVAFADVMKEMALAIDPWVGPVPQRIAELDPSLIAPSESWGDFIQFSYPWARLSILVNGVGWENAKTVPDVRRFLQRLGTEGGRQCLGDSIWIKATWDRYVYPYTDSMDPDGRYDSQARFVFSDVRFENEVQAIRAVNGELWRIDRPGVEDGDPHPSERAWREATPDLTITNDGTLDELEAKVHAALTGGVGS